MMEHLKLEALARLVDEAPSAAEAEHLKACEACRAELVALRDDVSALAELPDLLPPPAHAWPRLEARLRDEGLIRAAEPHRARGERRWLRAAAAVLLFLLGGATGYRVQPGSGAAGASAARAVESAPARSAERGPVVPGAGGRASADTGGAAVDAIRALEEAEAAYLAALTRYAEFAAAEADGDPRARLAALEEIVVATREALAAAPADPVINGYHLTALAQREAAMRQLALGAGARWF